MIEAAPDNRDIEGSPEYMNSVDTIIDEVQNLHGRNFTDIEDAKATIQAIKHNITTHNSKFPAPEEQGTRTIAENRIAIVDVSYQSNPFKLDLSLTGIRNKNTQRAEQLSLVPLMQSGISPDRETVQAIMGQ